MIGTLGAAVVGSVVLVAAAALPRIDVGPSCRAAAQRAADASYLPVCLRKEQDARQAIERQWREFTAGDKEQCVSRAASARRGTYTELLTCLELTRDVRLLRAASTPRTMGRSAK